MCLPPTTSPKPLISELTISSKNDAMEIYRIGPSAASRQTYHPFVPSSQRFAPWTIGRTATPTTSLKVVTLIHDYVVTNKLREATLQAYLNPNNFYNLHLKYVRTHPAQVIACLILVVAKLSDSNV